MHFLPISKRNSLQPSAMCLVCFILGLALTMLALTGPPALAKQAEIDLSILHVNDTHGHIIPYLDKSIDPERHVGGAEYLAKMVEQERAANPDGTILLSAGDMFQGTPISNLFHGKPVIEIMNFLHYDAMALGNHEFDWGQHVLQDIIHSASFPVVSANIYKGGGHIKGVKPYVILKRKGIRIAVIGLTTPETRYSTKAENVAGLTFENPEKILPSLIRQVKAQGASMVIVLSHDGLDSDRLLARKVRGIDVIVGGHSHTVIKDPVVESGTVIVQAGSNGVYLGVLHVSYNSKSKKIVDYTSKDELKLVSPSPGSQMDPNVAMIIDKYDTQVRAEFSKVIGTAAADFTKDRVRESSLGDLVADAMRESSGAEIAFQNAGGIRADIQKGPITLETLFTALPFDDDLVSMDLAGEKITELLEKTASLEKILQVSGMRIVYDMSDPSRVKLAAVEVAGNPIDPRKTYRVVTNDFLATSGGAFSVFKQGRNISFGQQQRDAVAGYIRQNSPISPNVQDRIIFKK